MRVEGQRRDSAYRRQADSRKAMGSTCLLITVEREGSVSTQCRAALGSEETQRLDSTQMDPGFPCFFIVSIPIEREPTICHAGRSRLMVNEGGGPKSQHVECGRLLSFILPVTVEWEETIAHLG